MRTLIHHSLFSVATNTDLPSYTPDIGGAWVETGAGMSGNAVLTVVAATGRLREGNGNDGNRAVAAPASSGADMDVEADVYCLTLLNFIVSGIIGRFNTSAGTRLEAGFEPTGGQPYGRYSIEDTAAGTLAYYNLPSGEAWTAGEGRRLRLECRGTVSRLYVDGVLKITHTAPNNVAGMRGGVVGINFTGGASATEWDDFRVYDVYPGPVVVTHAALQRAGSW